MKALIAIKEKRIRRNAGISAILIMTTMSHREMRRNEFHDFIQEEGDTTRGGNAKLRREKFSFTQREKYFDLNVL